MNAVSNSSLAPRVKAFFDEPTNTFSYVVQDPTSNACAIIDSVLDFDYPSGTTDVRSANEIIAHVREHELEVEWILETHVHADHLSAGALAASGVGGQNRDRGAHYGGSGDLRQGIQCRHRVCP